MTDRSGANRSDGAIKKAIVIVILLPVIVPMLVIIGMLRIINEITTRVVARAVVICPHCGVPGIIKSKNPQVVR